MIAPMIAVLEVAFATASSTNAQEAVYVDPLEYNVVGADYAWRNSSFVGSFNPTGTTPPFIQAFDPSFIDLVGSSATIRQIASNPDLAFAHEAPIYVPDLNVVFFSSTNGDWYTNNIVEMINMTEVDTALASTNDSVNVQVQTLDLADTVQMVNGGTGPYKGNLLFATSGRALLPPSIVLVNPSSPYNTTVLLDNFYGRQFNSLNDIKVLPGTDIMFFTDPSYGWLNQFRPEPMLPSQWSLTNSSNPNGIAFTSDGTTAFVTDSGAAGGFLGNNQTRPTTISDTNGNVYSGCGDGVQFFVGSTTPEMVFTQSGLVILSEETMYLANIEAQGVDLITY
ncbi:hypothetical protein BU15DRAFT_89386 [Melanogaster broomeanus]|nr:hypothetical protein BU15DRAFT_89386 [Melanogaster broomeanus]